ncbi:MAG: SDR family oxidoreductase [Candidatus Omnitrophota bacterium]
MKQKRFLVTGGAGFIGSNIVERLLKEGHFVRVLDNFSSGKEENLDFVLFPPTATRQPCLAGSPHGEAVGRQALTASFDIIRGDIRDYAACLEACADIDYVLHQAALRSVPKSMTCPHDYNAVNIDGTLNMLEAAAKQGVKRLVMASSSSVYGDAEIFPQKEEHPSKLLSPYALSKLAGEYYCRIFSQFFNLETVCLRYFNVFGPKQALDDEYAVVIPKFIHCILNNEQPPIFGTGKQSRDFTYIDNVVEANILAAAVSLTANPEPLTANPVPHAVLNVATGKDNTVLELVQVLNKIIGKDIKPKFLPVRAGDAFRTNADITKLKKTLSYTPKVTFAEGLRRTVEWFKKLN